VSYLLDTNAVSELRKGERCEPNVLAWYSTMAGAEKFLSVLTIGEIRRRDTSSRLEHSKYGSRSFLPNTPRGFCP